jgi:hypothetical protein
MSKSKTLGAEPITGDDLAEALNAIAQAAKAQAASAAQIMQMMQQMVQMMQQAQAVGPGFGAGAVGAPAAVQINIWEDDPFSEEVPTADPPLAATIGVPVPQNNNALLQTRINEPAVAPGRYAPGTAGFRFWVAAEALARGINFWAPLLPAGTRWTTNVTPMQVGLNAGTDLNAFYSRTAGLSFFQQVVRQVVVYSGESADVVCHELGHAILDAIRPQLFNTASLEVAAFHESFGDMSAILCGLQVPTLRQEVLAETAGRLNTNSRLSRLAEQLGWAIRQLSPTAVDRDCLRNAANRFFYRPPQSLPPTAPATQMSSEGHSFSRVFTGAFLDALARMLTATGPASDPKLREVSRDLGRLLVTGVRAAPIVPAYYGQVAAAMIQADRALLQGRYRAALSSAFVEHGILTPGAAAGMATATGASAGMAPRSAVRDAAVNSPDDDVVSPYADDDAHTRSAEDAPDLPTRTVTTTLGIAVEVHAPAEQERFAVASATRGVQEVHRTPNDDAASFVEDLIQLGRIETESVQGVAGVALIGLADTGHRHRKTHTLVGGDGGAFVLKRLHFDCGLGGCV